MTAQVDNDQFNIEMVNLAQRQVMTTTSMLTITQMFDCDGELTDDPEAAVAVVAGADGEWYAIDVTAFKHARKVN